MSGGSQHNPNGRQPQLGPAWSPLQLQMASYLARAPAHLAPERGVTWHTPTPPHLYHVPAPSPPDPLQAMKMGSAASNSVFRHSATPPDLYRHTPTPPDKHRRHTPSPGDPKAPGGHPPTDLYAHLAPVRDKITRPEDMLEYARGGVDLSVSRPANGAPLVVRDAPTINSLIARHRPDRPERPRLDQLLERLAPHTPPAPVTAPPSVIVSRHLSSSPEDVSAKRKRKPEKTSRRPQNGEYAPDQPETLPVEPPPPVEPPDQPPPTVEPVQTPVEPPPPRPVTPEPEPEPEPQHEPRLPETENEPKATETTKFVEVENQLEKMFAGIVEQPLAMTEETPAEEVSAVSATTITSVNSGRGRRGGRRGRGRKKSNITRKGPYVAVRGPRESPASVCVVNAGAEEETEKRAPARARGPHRSTLGAKYDAQTADATWVCAFCAKGPHAAGAGDLFGPYAGGSEGEELWTHAECALWAPGVLMAGARAWGLAEGVSRAGAVRCDVCGAGGAALACATRGCGARAHVCCARAHLWTLNDHTFRAHCPLHTQR